MFFEPRCRKVIFLSVVAEKHRAKLQEEQALLSDVTSPLSDLDIDEGHLKDVSLADLSSSADVTAAAMLDGKGRDEADDDAGSRDQTATTSRDPVILLTLTELEVITEGELLDVSMSTVDDFQLEVDWQRKQRKPELEIAACALP